MVLLPTGILLCVLRMEESYNDIATLLFHDWLRIFCIHRSLGALHCSLQCGDRVSLGCLLRSVLARYQRRPVQACLWPIANLLQGNQIERPFLIQKIYNMDSFRHHHCCFHLLEHQIWDWLILLHRLEGAHRQLQPPQRGTGNFIEFHHHHGID